jgi:zinc protease
MLVPTRIASALLALMVASGCVARTASVSSTVTGPPSHYVLPNGVHVVVEEQRSSDVVALQLWVRAGGRDEAPSELGLAHYLEHMLFKGTTMRPAGFIDREVEGVGGRMNAGTSLDYTYYHMLLPAQRALAGIETLADISVNASLDETQLEREKRVVLEELRLGEDNPTRLLMRRLYQAAFDGHPYGRPVIGRLELIRSLKREQLAHFYRSRYVPEAFTLVVVGAVNPAAVLEAATRAFGRLPRSGTGRLPPPAVGAPRTQHVELTRPGTYAYLGLAWPAPRLDHAETPAVDLLIGILGQSRSSRLVRAVRDRLGLVNSITTGYEALEGAGVVTVTAQLPPANLERVQMEILGELRRLHDRGVTDAELERALTAEVARHEFQMETVEGRARLLGRAVTVWTLDNELAYLDRLRSVTTDQILVAARRYLDPDRFVRVVLRPDAPR